MTKRKKENHQSIFLKFRYIVWFSSNHKYKEILKIAQASKFECDNTQRSLFREKMKQRKLVQFYTQTFSSTTSKTVVVLTSIEGITLRTFKVASLMIKFQKGRYFFWACRIL